MKRINGEIDVKKHKLKPITSYCGAFVRIQSFDVPIKMAKKKFTSFFVSNLRNTLKRIEENTATREKEGPNQIYNLRV